MKHPIGSIRYIWKAVAGVVPNQPVIVISLKKKVGGTYKIGVELANGNRKWVPTDYLRDRARF